MRQELDVTLEALVDTSNDSGIAGGAALSAFAEAIVGRDPQTIAAARQAVIDELGEAAMVDAAGVASNFQKMVRIADGTGIPLGDGLEQMSEKTRAQLGLDRWDTKG